MAMLRSSSLITWLVTLASFCLTCSAISVSLTNATVATGTTLQWTCTITPAAGATITTVTWSSSQGGVVFYYNTTYSAPQGTLINPAARATGALQGNNFVLNINPTDESQDTDEYTCAATDSTGANGSASAYLTVFYSSGLPLDVVNGGNSLPLSSCANPDITVVPVPTILDLTCNSYNSDPEPSLSWTTSNNVPFSTDDAVFVNTGNRYNASMTVHLNLTQKGIDFTATCGFNVAGSAAQSVCVRITTEPDPCSVTPAPCQNNGQCWSDHQNVTCTCDKCSNGTYCENVLTRPCDSSPCLNGATCNNDCNAYAYTCACSNGWKGPTCNSTCDLFINGGLSASPSQLALLGNQTVLTCYSPIASSVAWSRNADGSNPVATTATYTLTSTLSASSGTWYCIAKEASTGCTEISRLDLTVYYTINPNATETINDTLTEGDSKTYDCSATGEPTPALAWYFLPAQPSNQTSTNTWQLKANDTINSNTLSLDSVTADSAGTYACKATFAGDVKVDVKVVNIVIVPHNHDHGLEPWQIFLIVLACVLFVVGVALLIFFLIKYCNKNGSGTVQPEKDDKNRNTLPPSAAASADSRQNGARATTAATENGRQSSRALPDAPATRRTLPALNVEEERERLGQEPKKKRKVKKQDEEEKDERRRSSDDEQHQRGRSRDSDRHRKSDDEDDDDEDRPKGKSKKSNFDFRNN